VLPVGVFVSETAKAHHCNALEVMMETGNAHSEFVRYIFNFKLLIEVFAQMTDCLGNALSVSS
jgi:hypothetical protein